MGDSFFVQSSSHEFEPTPWTRSPWGPTTQHAGPVSGLLVRAMQAHRADDGFRLGRVSVDMLSQMPVAPVRLALSSVRAGKRVELVEVTASVGDRTCMIARGWLMQRVDSAFPAAPATRRADDFEPKPQDVQLPGAFMDGYMSALDWCFETGGFDDFGPARAWVRPRLPLLEGEPTTAWQRTMVAADSIYGVALTYHPFRYPLINCDLTVVLDRDSASDWVCMDAETTVVAGGGAAARALLSDRDGPVGSAVQTMFASIAEPKPGKGAR